MEPMVLLLTMSSFKKVIFVFKVESSSFDYIGIYVAPVESVLSLFPVLEGVEESGPKSTLQVTFNRGTKVKSKTNWSINV